MTYRQRVNIGPNQCHKTKSTSAYSNRTKSKLTSNTMFQPTNLYPFNCTFLFWFTMDWVRVRVRVKVFHTCGWGMYGNGIIIAVGEGLNTVYLTLMHSNSICFSPYSRMWIGYSQQNGRYEDIKVYVQSISRSFTNDAHD